jgi:hypothetical protein
MARRSARSLQAALQLPLVALLAAAALLLHPAASQDYAPPPEGEFATAPPASGTICHAFPGFTALADHNGQGVPFDVGASTQDAAEKCMRNPRCEGFDMKRTVLYMYTSVVPIIPESGNCWYTKIGKWGWFVASCEQTLGHSCGPS